MRLAPTLSAVLLAPALATATPEAIEDLAATLPEASADEVAALAEAHVGTPLEHPYERTWWYLAFLRWCEVDADAASAFGSAHADDPHILYDLVSAAFDRNPGTAEAFARSIGGERSTVSRETCLPAKRSRTAPGSRCTERFARGQ